MGLSVTEIRYIAGSYDLTYDEVLEQVQELLKDILQNTTIELIAWIKKKVPKRTGQLRQSLLDNLESSQVQKGLMRIILGTHLNYAKFVNEMSTSQVAHSGQMGYAYYYGNYGKIVLLDPDAI